MIEDNKFLDQLLSELIDAIPPMTASNPRTKFVETPESDIQFNGKQKVVPKCEIREKIGIIGGLTPEQYDRLAAQDQALSVSKTVTEFEEHMKRFDELHQTLIALKG